MPFKCSNHGHGNSHAFEKSPARITPRVFLSVVVFFCIACPSAVWGACPPFGAAVSVGNVEQGQSVLINEASGIAASNINEKIFWVNNDSGDSARIHAINHLGQRVGTYNLTGAIHYDYEDIAVGPGPAAGQEYIYISDTGDNARARHSGYYPITVYRVSEPVVNYQQSPVTVNLSGVVALPMRYPSTVYDCETLLVDPVSGDIFLVTRDRDGAGYAYVYRNPAPHAPGVLVTLELVASIPYGIMIKGGAISPDGDMVILRPHPSTTALLWQRPDGTALGDVFSQTVCGVGVVGETQGEAICFDSDGCGYYTVGEGTNQPLYYHARQGQCPKPTLACDFDDNGVVDLLDYSFWSQRWLLSGCMSSNNWCEGADLDQLGDVDLEDLYVFAAYWLEKLPLDISVASSNDDAEELADGYMYFNSTDIELINDPGRGDQVVGLRFTDVNIEPGRWISNAYIQFTVDEVSTGTCSLDVMVEDADDSVAFSGVAYNISNREVTTSVAWNPPDWTTIGVAGTAQRTNDIATLIQQIVDRPGWTTGNALTVIISGSGRRTAVSFEGNSGTAARLHIEF